MTQLCQNSGAGVTGYGSNLMKDNVEDYVLGRLTGPDCVALEEHLLVCSDCRDRLDETEDFVRGVQGILAL